MLPSGDNPLGHPLKSGQTHIVEQRQPKPTTKTSKSLPEVELCIDLCAEVKMQHTKLPDHTRGHLSRRVDAQGYTVPCSTKRRP